MKRYNKTRLPREGDRLAEVVGGEVKNIYTILEEGVFGGLLAKVRLDAWSDKAGWLTGEEVAFIDPNADNIRIVSSTKEEK